VWRESGASWRGGGGEKRHDGLPRHASGNTQTVNNCAGWNWRKDHLIIDEGSSGAVSKE